MEFLASSHRNPQSVTLWWWLNIIDARIMQTWLIAVFSRSWESKIHMLGLTLDGRIEGSVKL